MTIWRKIESLLKQNINLYLLTVADSQGSAPGRRGYKMLVAKNGELFGSIGGGVMEYNMVEKAKQLLVDGIIQQHCLTQDHRINSKASSGMICSGSQIIVFNHLTTDDLMLVSACTKTTVMLEFSGKGIKSISLDEQEYFTSKFADIWSYTQLLNNPPRVHLFGAGHVSVPTSALLTKLGFNVYLYDNRQNINTYNANQHVLQKKIISYDRVATIIDIEENDYIILMTHKFIEDKLLLSQLIKHSFKYLGVLGSKNKIQQMFTDLLAQSYTQESLDKIHAPIGIDINSQSPDEIAVSIVAEIIKIKN
ncbi:MAG: XdhC family protein [Proteobacteria bacterium]|nr:XdhC family protein [Pseudomonadota bacterium]